MPNLRRNFLGGKMNKDADERLLQDGEYIHAENIEIINSEGSDTGSVQTCYSNKQLTSINFGTNVETQGKYEDDFRDKIYWWVRSSLGCYVLEWDNASQSVSFVLKETRAAPNRVLDLKSGTLITGIEKIVNDNIDDDLLIWTDNNMEICCVNIERAKKYGENGFDIEDVTLIKKPPRFAPTATLFYSGKEGNNIEEKFPLFAYRYQYLDNEWSPLSSFTNYKFNPKPYKIDYYTLDNIGMVNAQNAVNIDFNVGDKRVKAVQIITKESNSNNLYIIETFDKEKEGWSDNTIQRIQFSNNKNYRSLPSTELARTFDNVPRKAATLTLIGNRLIIGNYLEGYNIAEANGKKIKLDYNVSLKSIALSTGNDFTLAMSTISDSSSLITILNATDLVLKKGFQIIFSLAIEKSSLSVLVYQNSFQYVLDKDYENLQELFLNSDFISFTNAIINDFALNYKPHLEAGETIVTEPVLSIFTSGLNEVGFNLTNFTYNTDPVTTVQTQYLFFTNANSVSLIESSSSSSCKSNRDYEVGLEYIDSAGRETVVLTCPDNSIYIPNEKSEYKNTLSIEINNPAPFFADRFKLVVKTPALSYYTLAVNNFYVDGAFVWIKLEGANIDKVKTGEYLILKARKGDVQNTIIKTKVLELSEKLEDFITASPIKEPAGYYMKIKPNGFEMSQIDNKPFTQTLGSKTINEFCYVYLDLNTVYNTTTLLNEKQKLPPGSEIKLKFNSRYKFDAGWSNKIFEKTYYIQREYSDIKSWFDEVVRGNDLKGTEDCNYNGKVDVVVGDIINAPFTPNPLGKEYMYVEGLKNTSSGGRYNYLDATIEIRISTGDYIFETEPKKDIEQNVFFKTEQTFEIFGGNHLGNIQDQDGSNAPCIIDLDFFNCYAQGNGVESYQIKDAFNKPYLNIDNKPTSTITEEYKEIRRLSDLTCAERYVESTNRNGLNEFNQARGNFKELDKGFGAITRLISRDSNIIVFQEEKVSQVLYEKDEIKNADGSSSLIAIDKVLGRQIPYMGENGCQHPESIAVYDFQVYYANVLRGVYQRLSVDGVSDIVTGMKSYFRNLFIERPTAKVLGGYDPYFKKYVTSVGEQRVVVLELQCGNIISKHNISIPFTYNLKINDLSGNIVLNYVIAGGNATIEALFDESVTVVSNVTGSGNLTIPRTNLAENIVAINVTPISAPINFEITNNCPVGIPLKVVSIVLGDVTDATKSITNRYKWGTTPYYGQIDTFLTVPLTRFTTEIGVEGQGKFPFRANTVKIQSYSRAGQLGSFSIEKTNRLGYLISPIVYTDADIDTVLSLATFPTVTKSIQNISNVVHQASFTFAKTTNAEILYLIWDYRDLSMINWYNFPVSTRYVAKAIYDDYMRDYVEISVTSIEINGVEIPIEMTENIDSDNLVLVSSGSTDIIEFPTITTGVTYSNFCTFLNTVFTFLELNNYSAVLSLTPIVNTEYQASDAGFYIKYPTEDTFSIDITIDGMFMYRYTNNGLYYYTGAVYELSTGPFYEQYRLNMENTL